MTTKRLIGIALVWAFLSIPVLGAVPDDGNKADKQKKETEKIIKMDDFQIVKDEVTDSVRFISAIPSNKVCPVRIDIEVSGNVVRQVVFTGGCNGNGKGIGALVKGMTVQEAVSRLKGIQCKERGTSCPDQLARILEATCLK